MNENITDHSLARVETPEVLTRRRFLEKLSIALGSFCAAVVGLPLIGFVIAPLFRKAPEQWASLGKVGDFEIGKTVNVTVLDPSPLPWAGITAKNAVWLRRESDTSFIAFSANCTHLGCPVRWMEGAELFLCPCHGGAYYKDGSVAAGPPPRPLFRYDVRIENGEVKINSVVVPISTTL
jgi:quinol---cytochrome c reductase iron-sulfur subunit, bacillus type